MTTLDIIDLIIAALFGAAICLCFCMAVQRRHKKAWQAEYRRLMGGIERSCELIELGNVGQALRSLSDVYYDNPNWPRK